MKTHDFIVLGGGTAGYAAADLLQKSGLDVAIIEADSKLGGTCILRGCMPSKVFLYTAQVAHQINHAEQFGLQAKLNKIDYSFIKARKEKLVAEWAGYRADALSSDRFTLYRAKGKFIAKNQIELSSGEKLEAKNFLIATGSRPHLPEVEGVDEVEVLTSDEVLDLEELPKSIIFLGAGVISSELSQFLARLGVKVTILMRGEFLGNKHFPESSPVLEKVFKEDGITILKKCQYVKLEKTENGTKVHFIRDNKFECIQAEKLVAALGRVPNTDSIGLEHLPAIKTNDRGFIETDKNQLTGEKHVYSGGDCADPTQILHLARMQGEVVANHFLKKEVIPVDPKDLFTVIFTEPQVASVGYSVEELNEKKIPFKESSYPFNDHGKSVLMEHVDGFVKLYVHEKTKVIVRAECVGPDAGELIQPFAVAVANEMTTKQMLRGQWYHPTLMEIWTYPLEDLL
jgi:pyruvate/2-oxoglutarate dehydrogenase complex dihydrolipoamide dehydrogenase (E3) component